MSWKRRGRKDEFRYSPEMLLEGLKKFTDNFSQYIPCPGLSSNRPPATYRPQALLLESSAFQMGECHLSTLAIVWEINFIAYDDIYEKIWISTRYVDYFASYAHCYTISILGTVCWPTSQDSGSENFASCVPPAILSREYSHSIAKMMHLFSKEFLFTVLHI
jgi:hypothetical protein